MVEVPFITVIMPIRNEAGFIARSLGAVLAQDYPHGRMEVLVADGMSTDKTREVISELAKQSRTKVTVLNNPGGIVPTGINSALAVASGEVIIRVDGHTIIAPDYLHECIAALQRTGADNVGGRMDPISAGPFGQSVAIATSSPFGVGGARFHYSDREEWVDTVYMGAWRRDVFEHIGQFDEELVRNQDDEFNYRLRSRGGRILLSPRIKSLYFNRSTLQRLWRQYLEYGYWKVRVMQKHPLQMQPRHFVPFLFVASLILTLLSALFTTVGKWLFVSVLVTYVIANLAASIHSCRKGSWRVALFLPLTFAILHVAYGVGFMLGLVKFWNGWITATRKSVPTKTQAQSVE
jgi:succinoglycan biosynthesis protein ExoA